MNHRKENITNFCVFFCYIYLYIVKRQYYVLARKNHPDRVLANKEEATEKFSVLNRIHNILCDAETKERFDTEGIVEECDYECTQWIRRIKPISSSDMDEAKQKYVGSQKETEDIIREMKMVNNGSIVHLYNTIPFFRREDEDRIVGVVSQLMKDGKIEKKTIKRLK